MQIPNFTPFVGQHCETTATGCLLKHIGIELTEPMLFGLGEGLGFIYWNMKSMDFPFIGGRVKPGVLTGNICRNLGLAFDVKETTSIKKAWQNCTSALDDSRVVGLKLDCFHLNYFNTKIHFAGHYVALYGYDHEDAFLVDTDQQGGCVKTSLASLQLARSEKGPMSSRNLSYTISRSNKTIQPKAVVKQAIQNNAREYLNPPITNLTYKGILKASKEIKKWFAQTENKKRDFQTTAMLMERAGTGGSLFRNLYRDFLSECRESMGMSELTESHEAFVDIAGDWKRVSELFHEAGETGDATPIDAASQLLKSISQREFDAMQRLASI